MNHAKRIEVTDVVLRDAHQSLIATRLRTEDMLPICDKLDKVGYWSLKVWGGATFDACVRFLKEDPWERLRQLREALPNTRLQMLLRGQNLLGYRHYADDVVEAFVQKAADNGIDVFRIFDALKGTDYDTELNLTLLSEIADYFREVRKKYQQFESEFTREDVSVQVSQVPGGMMSNLANQLKEQNALDRIREVFDEIPRVREDLGFPPLVTPTSQIVGTQAVYNVLAGQRYKTITNEVKRYLQGGYGQPPAPVNADVRKKATAPGHVSTAMPGNVVEVLVSEGDTVSAGQAVLITEAMKMETEVNANIDGKVEAVHVTKGDRVTPGEVLIEIG